MRVRIIIALLILTLTLVSCGKNTDTTPDDIGTDNVGGSESEIITEDSESESLQDDIAPEESETVEDDAKDSEVHLPKDEF